MKHDSVSSLSDTELLTETVRVAGVARRSTVNLLVLLAEVDARELFLGQGYSSMFRYCTQSLHLSEAAAYGRITAARAARKFPIIFTLIADGAVTLTTVSLLAAQLTEDNHEALLAAASHKSRREVELLVATLDPQPDVASSLRRVSVKPNVTAETVSIAGTTFLPTAEVLEPAPPTPTPVAPPTRRAIVAPLAADRYLLKITLSGDAHGRLERARDLLRHQIPSGDPAAIVDRALTLLVEHLERAKHASVQKPKANAIPTSESRHVPAAVKRQVWKRDDGQCAFVGDAGRCTEKEFLEFHHVLPYSVGGAASVANIQLRCRAHNAYEATLFEQSLFEP